MTVAQCKQFLVGLPASGKTTYLAALWHVVRSDEVEGAMRLVRMHGDQSYLNKVTNLWADAQQLPRTQVGSEQYVSMILADPNMGSETELVFPDLSGESFRLQWTDRQMKYDHAELIRGSIGGLVLIHPQKVVEESLIQDVMPIVNEITTTGDLARLRDDQSEGPTEQAHDAREWDPANAPTAMQLVDLLQFIASFNLIRPIRLSVIVSAWDRVSDYMTPRAWLEARLQLFWQYLAANRELFATATFGVSAQGGSLDRPDELLRSDAPSDRIRVVTDDGLVSHDITKPVQWVMRR